MNGGGCSERRVSSATYVPTYYLPTYLPTRHSRDSSSDIIKPLYPSAPNYLPTVLANILHYRAFIRSPARARLL